MEKKYYSWILVALLVLLLLGGNMMVGVGYSGFGMWFAFIVMIVFVLAIIWVVFSIFSGRKTDPLEILESRYANSEISKKQFEGIKKELSYGTDNEHEY